MKNLVPVLSIVLMSQTQLLHAQAETAHHRKVYAEINENADSYKKLHKEFLEENTDVEITSWSDKGELRKIAVNLYGDHGNASEEYYLENGRPLFVYTVYTTEEFENGQPATRAEDRYYFKGERMIKYLSGKKEPFDPDSRDFKMVEKSIISDFNRFKKLLDEKQAPKEAAAEHAVGKFTGIEEGDYFHWNMTDENGKAVSFFILKTDASIEKVVDNPKAFAGRKCRVKFVTSMEDIPEAGGEVEVSQITGVEWLK